MQEQKYNQAFIYKVDPVNWSKSFMIFFTMKFSFLDFMFTSSSYYLYVLLSIYQYLIYLVYNSTGIILEFCFPKIAKFKFLEDYCQTFLNSFRRGNGIEYYFFLITFSISGGTVPFSFFSKFFFFFFFIF